MTSNSVKSEIVKKIAIDAGKKIMGFYKEPYDVERKEDKSPLTEADLEANKIIISGLKNHFPEHAILTEEKEDDSSRLEKEYCWIVDPLDGTKEFIKKNGEFTVNIALVKNNKPILGVIYLPVKETLYYASLGDGAFKEEKGKKTKINVSDRDEINEMILIKSRSHASEKLQKIIQKNNFKDILTAGSSLKGCLVAEGKADVYYRIGPTHEWDICAMDIIVKEAGGKMTDLSGNEIKYNQRDTLINGFLVSNGRKHRELINEADKID